MQHSIRKATDSCAPHGILPFVSCSVDTKGKKSPQTVGRPFLSAPIGFYVRVTEEKN